MIRVTSLSITVDGVSGAPKNRTHLALVGIGSCGLRLCENEI
jgi:hypothetical protein